MVDKSIVRCAEEIFDQTQKYSKSNITMHISTLRITGCQYYRYINESFYYTVRRAKKLLKSFSVRYVATKMFIIKHLTFLLHLHSLYILEISSKFSLIKARLSSCRRLIYSYKNDTTLHKLNRFTIFYFCLMSGKRNTCLYSKFKLKFLWCRFITSLNTNFYN